MAETSPGPSSVDVVIVGNGPSAMILSYILHGHIPFYNPESRHPDPLLHAKLKRSPELLHLDIDRVTDHFAASRFSYSTQALPVNVLFDALIRPNGDDDEGVETCVQWRYMPDMAVPHVIFGAAAQPGGQWTECPAGTTPDIQSLSYAGMLSLPGYSFSEHHQLAHGSPLPAFTRPSRQAVAEYLAAYPNAVGIADSIRCGEEIRGVTRTNDGFYIRSHGITCRKLILASGVFAETIPPRPLLQPLRTLSPPSSSQEKHAPLLVIGSGFSAADIIISSKPDQKIIHVFKWEPDTNPSPLKGCHQQAYPEYASVYRLMKRAFTQLDGDKSSRHSKLSRGNSSAFLQSRNWQEIYEGMPNTAISDVVLNKGAAIVTFRRPDGTTLSREVGGLAYTVGRRSTLNYLDKHLLAEIFGQEPLNDDDKWISRKTLRERALDDLEVTRDVFIIGSLTGDSLIRFAHGGCAYVAGKLIQHGSDTGICPNNGASNATKDDDLSTAQQTCRNNTKQVKRSEYTANGSANPTAAQAGDTYTNEEPRPKSWWAAFFRLFR